MSAVVSYWSLVRLVVVAFTIVVIVETKHRECNKM